MKKTKIYEIKSKSVNNAKVLLSKDAKYFYWNNAKFLKNEIGDLVFIVNRHEKWICYTEIAEKDIKTEQDIENKTSSFNNLETKYTVSDPDARYDNFIRFDILEKKGLPEGWNWSKQLGQSETFDLIKEGIQGDTNRISKINDLKKIFGDGAGLSTLNEAFEFIANEKPTSLTNKKHPGREMNYNLRRYIIEILEQYKDNRTGKSFPGDGKIKDIVENKIPQIIHTILSGFTSSYMSLKVEGSVGKGQWATIPWIAILDPKVTPTVSDGVYIVYLFSADGNKVYLTLNQGTGGINRSQSGEKQIDSRKSILKILKGKDHSFTDGPLPENALKGDNNSRARSYEDACILWKAYTLEEIKNKSNENYLVDDLKEIIDIFRKSIKSKNNQNLNEPIKANFEIENLINSMKNCGLIFSRRLVKSFISSLAAKPFVLLTGLSGSGKTKLAQAFAMWICESYSQYCLIPVGSDWTNREPILGYPNSLMQNIYVKPDNGILDLLLNANENPNKPYFLILDEMNLSHVERYFADFLSVMESGGMIPLHSNSEGMETQTGTKVPSAIYLPDNFFIIGTVNVDETTYLFSPKVLDRASVIEFRINGEDIAAFMNNPAEVKIEEIKSLGSNAAEDFLNKSLFKEIGTEERDDIKTEILIFFSELKKIGSEFGFRTASEILKYANKVRLLEDSPDNTDTWTVQEIIDTAVMQKLLPKLHGSRRKLCPILTTLAGFCLATNISNIERDVFEKDDFLSSNLEKVKYPLSLEKIIRMYRSAVDIGFASYAEA